MKAMILAAGRGERMRPLTDTKPKPLLTLNGKALVEFHLEQLSQLAVEQVLINIAWLGEQITDFVGDGSKWGLTTVFSQEPEGALETAGGIIQALSLLPETQDDEPFLLINGDIYCQLDLSRLVIKAKTLDGNVKAHLVLVNNPEHNPKGDFALSHGQVSEVGEDKLTYSGIALIRPSLFSGLSQGRRALAPVLKQAMAKAQVTGEHYTGLWTDVGTPTRLNELSQRIATSK